MPDSLRRALVCCALLSAVAIPLSGCGSGDTEKANAYVNQVNMIESDIAAQFSKTAATIAPTNTPATDGKALDSFDAAITSGVRRLDAVKPPDKVKLLHAKLVATIDGFHGPIGKARSALKKKSLPDLASAQASFIASLNAVSADIKTVLDKINAKLHA